MSALNRVTGVHSADEMFAKEHLAGHMSRREFLSRATALGVTATAATATAARASAYHAIEALRFDGMHYRRDIATSAE